MVVRWEGGSSGFVMVHESSQKSKNIPKSLDRAKSQNKSAGTQTNLCKHFHTHTHTGTLCMLTLAWLNFLDDSQLVIDEHRRAEVSLECSRLMEESRKQKDYFSCYCFLYTDLAKRKMDSDVQWFRDPNEAMWKLLDQKHKHSAYYLGTICLWVHKSTISHWIKLSMLLSWSQNSFVFTCKCRSWASLSCRGAKTKCTFSFIWIFF